MSARPAPPPAEPDVYVRAVGEDGHARAATIIAGLRALGFIVADAPPVSARTAGGPRLDVIREVADVIIVVTPELTAALQDPSSSTYAELTHAMALGRVVVPVFSTPEERASLLDLSAGLRELARLPAFRFDPERPRSSIATIAHALSSDATLEDRKLERRATQMAWFVGAVFVGVLAFFVLPPVFRWVTRPAPKPPLAPLSVAWAGEAVADSAPASGRPLAARMVVRSGERILLAFAGSASGHAYVLSETKAGVVTVLFPEQTMRGASRVEAQRPYQVALVSDANRVEPAGPVMVRLFVSYDPLENLEELAEEPDARVTVSERLDLLTSTVAGLLDGRHAAGLRFARSRSGQTIDTSLPSGSLPSVLPLRRLDAGRLERTATVVRGAFSVLAEFELTAAIVP